MSAARSRPPGKLPEHLLGRPRVDLLVCIQRSCCGVARDSSIQRQEESNAYLFASIVSAALTLGAGADEAGWRRLAAARCSRGGRRPRCKVYVLVVNQRVFSPRWCYIEIMIHREPLTTKWAIGGVFSAGTRTKPDSAFRQLQKKEAVSGGIRVEARDPSGQVSGGRPTYYCALNADAARLARHGRWDLAERLVRKAIGIERRRETKELAVALGAILVKADIKADAWVELNETHPQLLRIVTSWVDHARGSVPEIEEVDNVYVGRVIKLWSLGAEVQAEGSPDRLVVPSEELEERGIAFAGALVALHREPLGGGRSIWAVEPAISVADVAEDEAPFSFIGRNRISIPAEEAVLGRDDLEKAIIPVPVRISVEA